MAQHIRMDRKDSTKQGGTARQQGGLDSRSDSTCMMIDRCGRERERERRQQAGKHDGGRGDQVRIRTTTTAAAGEGETQNDQRPSRRDRQTGSARLPFHLLLLARAREPREPHHRAELEHVLLPRHRLVLLAELARQHLAPLDVLRADKVARDLDAVREVAYLNQSGTSDVSANGALPQFNASRERT